VAIASNLGFPRIGPNRELKWAVESYWAGKSSEEELQEVAATVRRNNWQLQQGQGIQHIPSNDFSFYDQMLDTSAMIGAVPARYGHEGGPVGLDTYFAMARGTTGTEDEPGVPAMEMTKWFDTNYHYIVPELEAKQSFRLSTTKVVDEFIEAKALGIHTKPVLVGPVTYLLLSKTSDEKNDTLALLEEILPVYEQVLKALAKEGADWIQIDEPMLGLTLDDRQRAAFGLSFARLAAAARTLKIMATVYFSDLRENLKVALALPVSGLHIDLVRGPGQLDDIMAKLPEDMTLSLGLVDGRNIWKSDLTRVIATADHAASTIGINRVVIAPSCSLMHAPVDLDTEPELDAEMKSWLAFAHQKIGEIVTITRALNQSHGTGTDGDADPNAGILEKNARAMESRRSSSRIHNPEVKERIASIDESMYSRKNNYAERHRIQQMSIRLPAFPTTTIGSFPQTPEIRKARAAHNRGELKDAAYDKFLKAKIAEVIGFQEEVGLDVLVHGEPERNDMVEYFGQQMDGYVSTKNGWVQSYGSRCVKPPIIYGDVRRTGPMTVEWSKYAQSLTKLPVKGMLTGPITMMEWSFVRDDQPRSETCRQLALAIRDEVSDLERAGIRIIQIDEAAMREGLPLRSEDWDAYLEWAVKCFRLAASDVEDSTQIHTHMCYAEFNDIIEAIGNLDADVISMEASRSDMVLLGAFVEYKYPNEIGPGVYDIHSARVASSEEMKALLGKALDVLSPGQLWVNPDCGLKTRKWDEVKPSLENMVEAAKSLR
jgi:5-methyltetrahydropteroyltriglutamate--homocysteine methyltransferase